MPRAAPVTRATLPTRGRSQFQISGSVAGLPAAPMRITWPETYADLPESRNRSVDSIRGSAPGAT